MASLALISSPGRCWQSAALSPIWAPVPTSNPNDRQASPPAVLRAGIETQIGLSPSVNWREAGVPVIGDRYWRGQGVYWPRSRATAHGEILKSRTDAAGLAELRAIGERHGAGYLLTVSEATPPG